MSRIEEIRARRGAFAAWVTAHRAGKTLRAEVVADIDWLLARLAAVEALHPNVEDLAGRPWCPTCGRNAPCPTVRAARGESGE